MQNTKWAGAGHYWADVLGTTTELGYCRSQADLDEQIAWHERQIRNARELAQWRAARAGFDSNREEYVTSEREGW